MIPQLLLEEINLGEKRAEDIWQDGRPKKWWYAIPVIIIWVLILNWIIRLVLDLL